MLGTAYMRVRKSPPPATLEWASQIFQLDGAQPWPPSLRACGELCARYSVKHSCTLFQLILPKRNARHALYKKKEPELTRHCTPHGAERVTRSPGATCTLSHSAIIILVLQVWTCGTKALNSLQPRVERVQQQRHNRARIQTRAISKSPIPKP